MAGTVTVTIDSEGPVKVLTFTCVGDVADGTVPDTAVSQKISGEILALQTDPGTPAPTTLYDIVLDDQHAYDLLQGLGANRSATLVEVVDIVRSGTELRPHVGMNDTLTYKVANQAVVSAQWVTKVYFRGAVRAT